MIKYIYDSAQGTATEIALSRKYTPMFGIYIVYWCRCKVFANQNSVRFYARLTALRHVLRLMELALRVISNLCVMHSSCAQI